MSLLTVVQSVCRRVGLPTPTTVASSTDDQILQLLELANEDGQDLVTRYEWQALNQEATFTTVVAESQGDIRNIAPGMKSIVNDTIWNRSLRRPIFGPLTPQRWQQLKAMNFVGPWNQFRIIGNDLRFVPPPGAGEGCYFEYITKNWVQTAAPQPNLLQYAQVLDNAIWLPVTCGVATSLEPAPDGTTFYKLVNSVANGGIYQSVSKALAALPYTASAFVKAAEQTEIYIGFGPPSSGTYAIIDLTTGEVSSTATSGQYTNISAGAVALGDDVYRVFVTATSDPSAVVSAYVGATGASGTDGFYATMLQLEPGSTMTAYEATTTAAASSSDSYLNDSDVALLDEQIIVLGTIWRFRQAKGLDYAEDFAKYERRVTDAMAGDGSKDVLNLGEVRWDLFPGIIVPAGNWPIGPGTP